VVIVRLPPREAGLQGFPARRYRLSLGLRLATALLGKAARYTVTMRRWLLSKKRLFILSLVLYGLSFVTPVEISEPNPASWLFGFHAFYVEICLGALTLLGGD
jgi:hypothetical protein